MSKENVIIDKIGLDKETAKWILSLTKKHHIWVANQIKKNPGLINRKEDFKMIMDWKKEDQTNVHDIGKMSFSRAASIAKEFFTNDDAFKVSHHSLENKKVHLDLGDYKWVELRTMADCREEGRAMNNCLSDTAGSGVASGKKIIYSLRDEYNFPHVTLDISFKTGRISNMFGNANSKIKEEYIPYLAELLEENDLWSKMIPTYGVSSFANSTMRLLIHAANNEMYDLVTRIIRATSYNLKCEMSEWAQALGMMNILMLWDLLFQTQKRGLSGFLMKQREV